MKIDSGIPTIDAYNTLLKGELFSEMEAFSNKFLESNRPFLDEYSQKWVADPLHQWSRQWEYPYVFTRISEYAGRHQDREIEIMDAGSGVSFFPYFLSANLHNVHIQCCDRDSSLKDIYSNINHNIAIPVDFSVEDIGRVSFRSGAFDIIYCISVLEHTDNFEQIIREFKRLLKHLGMLIVTFDISIDGDSDIPPLKAEELLQALRKHFSVEDDIPSTSLKEMAKSKDILTTRYIKGIDRNLLPWKYPVLSALRPLLKFQIPKGLLKNLTIYCGVFINE